MRAPTGEQFRLTRNTPNGLAEAVIVQVAASIREFRIGGAELTEPYGEFSTPPFGDGIVLVPWPNRVEDGIWKLNGVTQQLDLTEPDKHNAIHGLLRNAAYRVIEQSDGEVTLGATVFPQHGYPFLLETSVRHELTDDGMTVTHRITNESDEPAPVAIGSHPFFQLGDVATDDLTLTVHAGTRFPVDERLNPSAEIPVDGTDYDLRAGRKVSDLNLDDAFGDVTPDNQVTAVLTAPDGRGALAGRKLSLRAGLHDSQVSPGNRPGHGDRHRAYDGARQRIQLRPVLEVAEPGRDLAGRLGHPLHRPDRVTP
jgi:aldose 1-epimerase